MYGNGIMIRVFLIDCIFNLNNYIMQVKQLKSLINANFLSPWGEDFDIDDFLAPPKSEHKSKPHLKYKKEQVSECLPKEKSIEQEAKKTLLNIDFDSKQKKATELKSYLNRKSKTKMNSIFLEENNELKLPPINNKVYNSIDYYNSYIIPSDIAKGNLDEIDVFRKYGDHRKSKPRESKVERSISLGGNMPSNLKEFSEKKYKFETLEPLSNAGKNMGSNNVKDFRLKGKKYSFDSRVESERQLNIDKYNYIPSQPNITPHYLLFGHSKEDVLKKVLQQINQKVK